MLEISRVSSIIMLDSPAKLHSSDSDLSFAREESLHIYLRKTKQLESELLQAFSGLQLSTY